MFVGDREHPTVASETRRILS